MTKVDIFGGIYKNDFPEYCPICRRAYEHQKHKHAQDQRYEEDKNEAMYILYGASCIIKNVDVEN